MDVQKEIESLSREIEVFRSVLEKTIDVADKFIEEIQFDSSIPDGQYGFVEEAVEDLKVAEDSLENAKDLLQKALNVNKFQGSQESGKNHSIIPPGI